MNAPSDQLPRPLLPMLGVVAAAGTVVAASTNVEALLRFGHALYGEFLHWTLAAAVITYEVVSSLVYFMSPRSLPALRKSAFTGAVLGFAATVGLAILWSLIEDGVLPGGLWLKIFMKPVPSLITAAFLHMFMIVWRAAKAAEAAAEETGSAAAEETGSAAAEETGSNVVSLPVPLLPSEPVRQQVEHPPVMLPAEDEKGPCIPVESAATDSAVASEVKPAAAAAADDTSLPRVAEKHVQIALEVLAEIADAGGNPAELRSGQAMRYWQQRGVIVKDRTVRAALQVARARQRQQLVPA